MVKANAPKIPKDQEQIYSTLTGLTDRFCAEHLNQGYADLARKAIGALCRKRPCPLPFGKPETWACAVLLALGQLNALTDRRSKPTMAVAELCGHCGVAGSTAGNKAKLIRTALAMRLFDHKWMLPEQLAKNPAIWLIMVNGFYRDARDLPLEVQEIAVKKGLIPFVWSSATETPASAGRT